LQLIERPLAFVNRSEDHALTTRCRQPTTCRTRRATRFVEWSSSCSAISPTVALGRNPAMWFARFRGRYVALEK